MHQRFVVASIILQQVEKGLDRKSVEDFAGPDEK